MGESGGTRKERGFSLDRNTAFGRPYSWPTVFPSSVPMLLASSFPRSESPLSFLHSYWLSWWIEIRCSFQKVLFLFTHSESLVSIYSVKIQDRNGHTVTMWSPLDSLSLLMIYCIFFQRLCKYIHATHPHCFTHCSPALLSHMIWKWCHIGTHRADCEDRAESHLPLHHPLQVSCRGTLTWLSTPCCSDLPCRCVLGHMYIVLEE